MTPTTIEISCSPELMLSLHMNAHELAQRVKRDAAIALFREGRLSSGLAAQWLGMPRVHFLLMAMEAGAELLEDTDEEFRRETALL
jgi:predicted HTH domain antitoxin